MKLQPALIWAQEHLQSPGVENPLRDARLLLAKVLGKDISYLIAYPDAELSEEQLKQYENYIQQRCQRIPVSRILGIREFWSLPFQISPDTLDPRPDTEILVEEALKWAKMQSAISILDLGTGSGCILIALLSELPLAQGIGVDINPGAIRMALENAASLEITRCAFLESSWTDALPLGSTFDLIVSNPPYIPQESLLEPEVALYDPSLALYGGTDGLECYRILLACVPKHLKSTGRLYVEIGQGQEKDVIAIGAAFGLECVDVAKDLNGINRCISFAKQG